MPEASAGSPRFARSREVVWRFGIDRVLVRRPGRRDDDAAADLIGNAALVWVALDDPATTAELLERMHDAGVAPSAAPHATDSSPEAVLAATVEVLAAAGWIDEIAPS